MNPLEISLDQMALFVALVHHRSFSQTAEQLNIPQSSLSRKINELEQSLGLKLLHRTTRKMELTEAGRFYFERASAIIAEAECTHQELNGMKMSPEGILKMSVPPEFAQEWLALWLPEFYARYPKISLEIDVSPQKANLLGDVDLVIRAGEPSEGHYIAHRLMMVDFHLYASKNYLNQYGIPKTPHDLLNHRCLVFQGVNEWALWRQRDSVVLSVGANPFYFYQSNNYGLLARLAEQGLGVALLPEVALGREIRLERVLVDWQGQSVPISVLTATRLLPLKVKCMMDFLKEKMGVV